MARPFRPFRAIRELIGGAQRTLQSFFITSLRISPNTDYGHADYAFADKTRRGKALGLQISGLMVKPLCSKIAAWSLGTAPRLRVGGQDKKPLTDWLGAQHPKILAAFEESLNLGDFYVVVNPDTSLTLIPPNMVTPIVNPERFSEIIGWRVEIALTHPAEPGRVQTERNEYYADRRVETVLTDGRASTTRIFKNLIGKIPVVHIANNNGSDEVFGRPEWEALVPMLHKYGQVFEAAVEGNIRHGRPTPVFSKLGSIQALQKFWDIFGKRRTVDHADGTTETETYLEFDADKAVTLAETGEFHYQSPQPFMADVTAIQQLFFYLLVEYGEIPEGFLGSAITGSRASLDTQLEPLVKFIEKKRGFLRLWLTELADIALRMLNLSQPNLNVDTITMLWGDLTRKDGALTVQAVQLGLTEGILDEETALMKLPLDIDNPKEVLAKAKKEREERQAAFDAAADARVANATAAADASTAAGLDGGEGAGDNTVTDEGKAKAA